jgi:alginate O-acetyltransferase complex protein AlgI
MLFHSSEFFIFLLVTLAGFHLFARTGRAMHIIVWLSVCSLFFYGWWNPAYLVLIGISIVCNYAFGRWIGRRGSLILTAAAVIFNLSLIGYFKYAGFLVAASATLTGAGWQIDEIILPLAISFFTFQQIAFVVDVYRGKETERNFVKYCFFVVFFPQLIAGPIVHHHQTIPQLTANHMLANRMENLSVGLTYFVFGLFKKLVIADGVAQFSTPAFEAAELGYSLSFVEAWCAALAYTFQIYFDFSGYSDMAIGLAIMFGVKLPINFHSPYKATSIIEFWRRWHMTLSAFLRDYLYIPLGGNRVGVTRKYFNIFFVMFLGGLWHGAGWTYIIWGCLHGIYLLVNHAFRYCVDRLGLKRYGNWFGLRAVYLFVTMFCVVVAWVVFRAESIDGAMVVMNGMIGANGIVLPHTYARYTTWLSVVPIDIEFRTLNYYYGSRQVLWYMLLFAIVVWAPNTHEIMNRYLPSLNPPTVNPHSIWRFCDWRPTTFYAGVVGAMALTALFMIFIGRRNEFLYFQF